MATATPVSFVRGGQVAIHFWRMFRQVFIWSCLAAIVFAVAFWLFRAFYSVDPYRWYLAYETARSDTMLALTNNPDARYIYHSPAGEQIVTTIGEFHENVEYNSNYHKMWELGELWAGQSLLVGGGVGLVSVLGFIFIGAGLQENTRVRGSVLVSAAELQYFVDRRWKKWRKDRGLKKEDEYEYRLAGVRYPPGAPMVHTMMVGTTGSGKTVAINELIKQIREKGDKAVIFDRMGNFAANWYDGERDFILNPFDDRDAGWSPFADATSGAAFANMAAALIPKAKGNADPFWNDSAQSVFANVAEKLANEGDRRLSSLRKILIEDDLATMSAFVEGTPAASLINETNEKTALSIRSALIPQVEFLKHMRDEDDEEGFSIRDWVASEPKKGSFMFLSGHVDHLNATRNLISVAIETAANATMTLDPTDRPRIWFIIDELPSLNYLPFLGSSLAEIRQFGGCFVVGYQIFSQLKDVYGPDMAETISGTINNRVFFSVGDHATAERCAKMLGREDIEERSQGMSLGANETRDGVTIQERRTERDIVTPSQIMDLPERTAFLRFGYDAPRAKVEFPYVSYKLQAPKFIPVGTSSTEGATRRRKLAATRAKAAKMAPDEPRHREETFLGEYEKWVASLVKCDDHFMSDYDEQLSKLDIDARKDHFLIKRLTGVPVDEIVDLSPTYPPADAGEREKYFDRIWYEQQCLNAFWARINGDVKPTDEGEECAENEISDSISADRTIDPETGEVTENGASDAQPEPEPNSASKQTSSQDSADDPNEAEAAGIQEEEPVVSGKPSPPKEEENADPKRQARTSSKGGRVEEEADLVGFIS